MAERVSIRGNEYETLQKSLHIDPMEIDRDLTELPTNMMAVTEAAAYAVSRRDTAKAAADIAESEAAHNMRVTAEDKPPTEAFITRALPRDPGVVRAQRAYEDAKLEAAKWLGLVEAMRTKQSSIKVMADLIMAGFLTRDHVTNHRRVELHAKRKELRESRNGTHS